MLWRGIMGFTKFGDKRVNDLDLLSGYVVGVGLCWLLPRACVLRKFVDLCIERDISVHLSLRVRLVLASLKQLPGCTICYKTESNIWVSAEPWFDFLSEEHQEKLLIAYQVEPNAEHCLIIWIQSCKTLEYVFPRQIVQNCETVKELQNLSVVHSIDFRKQITSLTVELANDSLVNIELVEKSIRPPLKRRGHMAFAECQVIFFPVGRHFLSWTLPSWNYDVCAWLEEFYRCQIERGSNATRKSQDSITFHGL